MPDGSAKERAPEGGVQWPEWWEWELELSSHLEKRMEERSFSEVELREMLEHARGYGEAGIEGR